MAIETDPLANSNIGRVAQSAATETNHSNLISDVLSGFGHAFRSQYDGARQMCGAKVDLSYTQNEDSAQKVGHAAGDATMFIGGALLMKKLPVIGELADGKVASIATGGVIGLTTPLRDGEAAMDRLKNAGLGAGTMSLLEYGPGAIGKLSAVKALPEQGLASVVARYGAANGIAGLANTEGQSLIATGHSASTHDLMLAAGTWMAMGVAAGKLGGKLENIKQGQAEANAYYAPENAPWQFKNVTDINAADLKPGEKLAPGNYRVSFMSEGAERKANIYISDAAAKSADRAPVVTHLHGLNPNGEAEGILSELNYYKLADKDGAVVAMLQGRNGLKGLGTFQSFHDTNFGFAVPPKGMSPYSDQVAFGDMMGIIKNHVPNANTDNIAVSGFSLGAKMANRIAATRADVGVVASIHGTMDHLDQQLMDAAVNKHPIDGIFVLGTKDKVLPLNGGTSLFTLGLENNQLSRPLSQAEYWGRSNGNPLPVVSDNPVVSTRQWSSPTHENTVTEYVVKGGAHAIDGAPPRRNLIQALMGVPKPAAVFDAREKTWDFMIRSIIARDLASKPGELAAAG
jgi:poly(3-hydroxybutyrate) depolymerase